MKKVYVVTKGCYSAYGIYVIFSEKKKAEEFIKIMFPEKEGFKEDDGKIEEWELDFFGGVFKDKKLYKVIMKYNGNSDVYEPLWCAYPGDDISGDYLRYSVIAFNEGNAVKISVSAPAHLARISYDQIAIVNHQKSR